MGLLGYTYFEWYIKISGLRGGDDVWRSPIFENYSKLYNLMSSSSEINPEELRKILLNLHVNSQDLGGSLNIKVDLLWVEFDIHPAAGLLNDAFNKAELGREYFRQLATITRKYKVNVLGIVPKVVREDISIGELELASKTIEAFKRLNRRGISEIGDHKIEGFLQYFYAIKLHIKAEKGELESKMMAKLLPNIRDLPAEITLHFNPDFFPHYRNKYKQLTEVAFQTWIKAINIRYANMRIKREIDAALGNPAITLTSLNSLLDRLNRNLSSSARPIGIMAGIAIRVPGLEGEGADFLRAQNELFRSAFFQGLMLEPLKGYKQRLLELEKVLAKEITKQRNRKKWLDIMSRDQELSRSIRRATVGVNWKN